MKIAREVVEAIVAHAREAAPAECCGVLVGGKSTIVAVVRARNLSTDPNRFDLDPQGHIHARRDARTRGLEVVGFYHSHPRSAADPSPTDLVEATYQGYLYAIVSLIRDPAEVRIFRLEDAGFRELPWETSG